MTNHSPENPTNADRLLDLLAEQAAAGLDDAAQVELELLIAEQSEIPGDYFEQAASAASQAFSSSSSESMPTHLRDRCIGSSKAILGKTEQALHEPLRFEDHPATGASRAVSSGWSSMGWVAAAACLMIAVFGWLPKPSANPIPTEPWINITSNQPQLVSQRDEFIKSHAETIMWNWSMWGEEYSGVTGDVVWDPQTNEGYMRFANLPENDPNVNRYQLWIVDQARGTPLQVPPVDGGLFDVSQTNGGDWVVHFRARLPVGDVFGFGVTVEDPDGVVISDQGIKAVIATAPAEQG
jgi:hypothetical protein